MVVGTSHFIGNYISCYNKVNGPVAAAHLKAENSVPSKEVIKKIYLVQTGLRLAAVSFTGNRVSQSQFLTFTNYR